MDVSSALTLAIASSLYGAMSIIENFRLWMGSYLSPFNIDESSLCPAILIAIVGLAGLLNFCACAPLAQASCKSFPSVRSLFVVPRAVPAFSNFVGEALGAAPLVGRGVVTAFYGSSVYGAYRKVVDWINPVKPEVMIVRMMLVSHLISFSSNSFLCVGVGICFWQKGVGHANVASRLG
jgi:hypothetical protein